MYEVLEELRDILETACGSQFNAYYIGKISVPMKADLPFLCIYGVQTALAQTSELSTCKDKYRFNIVVDIFVNTYQYISESGNNINKVIETQKAVYEKMEKRTDNIPDADTVLGALRRIPNLRGQTFLYNGDITIDYAEGQIDGTSYYKGSLTINTVANYNTRT